MNTTMCVVPCVQDSHTTSVSHIEVIKMLAVTKVDSSNTSAAQVGNWRRYIVVSSAFVGSEGRKDTKSGWHLDSLFTSFISLTVW